MRNFILLIILIVLFSVIAHAKVEPKFEKFIEHEEFVVNIELDSVKVIKGPSYPLISIKTQLVLTKPVENFVAKKAVKTLVSTVAADCKNDQLYMSKIESYGVNGDHLLTENEGSILKNPKSKNSPVTGLLLLICNISAKLNEQNKRNSDPMLNI